MLLYIQYNNVSLTSLISELCRYHRTGSRLLRQDNLLKLTGDGKLYYHG